MPPLVVGFENKLERALSAPGGSHIWWPSPSNWGRSRDNADVDHYELHDRDDRNAVSRCADSRRRSLATADRTGKQKFGPNAHDIAKRRDYDEGWSGQVQKSLPSWASRTARPESYYDHMNWKLDRYDLAKRPDFSLTTRDQSRQMDFNLSKAERFTGQKLFGKDYTRTGSGLNSRYSDVHTWKAPGTAGSGRPRRPERWR